MSEEAKADPSSKKRKNEGFRRVFAKIFGGPTARAPSPAKPAAAPTDNNNQPTDRKPPAMAPSPPVPPTALKVDEKQTKKIKTPPPPITTTAARPNANQPQQQEQTVLDALTRELGEQEAATATSAATTNLTKESSPPPKPPPAAKHKTTAGVKRSFPSTALPALPKQPQLPSAKRSKPSSFVIVMVAAQITSRALLLGNWPTPYDNLQQSATHMSIVGASLEKFTNDIVNLNMQVSKLRTFLGTLLLLREVLILNAGSIFGAPTNDYGSIQVLATAVILSALSDFCGNDPMLEEQFYSLFLDTVQEYDTGSDAFALPRLSPQQSSAESRAWQATWNHHCDRHPLSNPIHNRPFPTAVHVSILEAVAATPTNKPAES